MSRKSTSYTERITTLIATAAVTVSIFALITTISLDNLVYRNSSKELNSAIYIEEESLNCKYINNQVNCSFLITPLKNNEAYINVRDSRIIDNAGNIYTASSATIGNNTSSEISIRIRLVKDIPVKMSVSFDNINQLGSKLALFEIDGIYSEESPSKQIYQIKDIEISK